MIAFLFFFFCECYLSPSDRKNDIFRLGMVLPFLRAAFESPWDSRQQWWRLPPEKSADQFFQNIAQQKAVLIFSAILAKRGNLNLDLNLDLRGDEIKKKSSGFGVVASSFFLSWCCTSILVHSSSITRHACCWVLKCNDNNTNSWYDRLQTTWYYKCLVEVYEWVLKCNNIKYTVAVATTSDSW